MSAYSHPRTEDVLEAYKLLLNEALALDYCGITGNDRKLILNDSSFMKVSKQIKAGKYIEEIEDINSIVRSLSGDGLDDNSRMGTSDEDPSKVINLKLKLSQLRRDMLSLTASDNESDEVDSLNIFFIDVTREEFEKLQTIEFQEGSSETTFTSEDKETPMERAAKVKDDSKAKTSIPKELQTNTIEYTDEDGNKIIEEVAE